MIAQIEPIIYQPVVSNHQQSLGRYGVWKQNCSVLNEKRTSLQFYLMCSMWQTNFLM
jgi:hypothetical protein